MAQTRGMRFENKTLERLKRLVRVTGKTQPYVLDQAIDLLYQAMKGERLDLDKLTAWGRKYGDLLRAHENLEAQEAKAKEGPKELKPRGAVIRLSPDDAVQLRRHAYEQTGDPGLAPHLAREAIREKLREG
ncbi:MAG TPA: hypothetical protein VNT01_01210 [Symbiobacteriaceae bacterium]|nr:hypothetical protein [Symbiobacteriaceae bacterium]